ncbi:hypothetical protein CDAR_66981 [Caerostris darwini]|uniref:Uncharacterized protein n=1 Tax=Caerostris darwini TaxID=1538125 RepID=A0AAV4QV07_9ARAC|nr:hypothetical protein CDAR_66981 [Caerostris darwini]
MYIIAFTHYLNNNQHNRNPTILIFIHSSNFLKSFSAHLIKNIRIETNLLSSLIMALLTNGHWAVLDNGGCDTPRAVTCGRGQSCYVDTLRITADLSCRDY